MLSLIQPGLSIVPMSLPMGVLLGILFGEWIVFSSLPDGPARHMETPQVFLFPLVMP